ncbi:SseB family protein [Desulfuromonas sp. KJ2020]|uniref:SseB family protein n=1 Tax=Desulfuromonas sp. KJ2020 TaxID=2919173 RepID=UPI0020A79B94|nr:SseB family protein [Desulfuromonas sp. KJ2020]MCP3178340.1 SseB family protein [Desulfuromonas sp. KJ2020]
MNKLNDIPIDELVEKAAKFNAYGPKLLARLREVEVYFISGEQTDGQIRIQEFIAHNNKPFIPIFASEASFLEANSGSRWSELGVAAKIENIVAGLADDDMVIINPHKQNCFLMPAKIFKK